MSEKTAAPIRVLLVEDNPDDYLIVRDLLSDIALSAAASQFNLEWVETFDAARETIAQNRHDICLTDHRLGERSGLDLLREFPSGAMPFVLLTGIEDYEIDAAATKAGASDYLVKRYINAPILERSIRYAIERKTYEAALLQAQRFAQATVDALPGHLAVLDASGTIIAVNKAWREFDGHNGFVSANDDIGANYLQICDNSTVSEARDAASGIRAVIAAQREDFCIEYPCHTASEPCWFKMCATRFSGAGPVHVVVAHENITQRKLADEKIRDSEANLATAQKIAHLGSWEKDLSNLDAVETTSLRWSDEVFRIFGYEPGEIEVSLENFLRAVHPDDRARIGAATLDTIAHGTPYSLDHRIFLPDGTQRIVHEQAQVIYSASGQPLKMVGTVQDITERKHSEAELRASEARFQSIVANVPGMVYQFVLNPDGSTQVPFVNEGCRELFELEPEEIRRRSALVTQVVHPDDRAESDRLMAHSAATLCPWRWEGRIKLPSGKIKWVQGASRPQRLPDGGTLWDGLLLDITARKEAEEERDRFFTLSLDMLAIVDGDGAFKRLNPAFEETLGFSNAHLMSKPVTQWVHPDDRAVTRAAFEELAQGAQVVKFENRCLCRDGSYKWLSWRSIAFEGLYYAVAHDISKIKRAEAALHKANDELELRVMERTAELADANANLGAEITERKMALSALRGAMEALQTARSEEVQAREAADAANRAKSEFLSRMSHELRTPLNAILGFGQILEMRDLGPKESEGVAQILRAGRHLLNLINEVLDMARIEAGHLSLSREPLEVADVVRESLELVRPLAAAQGIELIGDYDMAQTQTWHVLADRQRLHQVLINLLSNAIKYNRENGKVTLRCKLVESDASQPHLRIEVSDSGYGLSPADLGRLFVPFERLGAERGTIEGTGIGLSLCKHLVEAMEGRIGVRSELQRGSTFWIELPLAEQTSMLRHNEDLALPVTPPNFALATQTATLLHIEDNISNVRVIERLFADWPHLTLLTAMQGEVGVEMAKEHQPDLILLDIHLPDIEGDEVLSRLQSCEATRNVPVVVLSADATQKTIDKLLQCGARNYLTKPLDIKQLLGVVETILCGEKAPTVSTLR